MNSKKAIALLTAAAMAASSVSLSVFANESEQPTEAPAAVSENYTDERFSTPVFWDGMESPLQDAAVAPVLMQEDNVINYNGNKTELIQLDSKLQRIFPSDLQIPCPELNGVYFYDGSTLIFYDFGSKSYSKVAVFDGGYDYYAANGKLYLISDMAEGVCVYDLVERKTVTEFSIPDHHAWVIGADDLGRIYLSCSRDSDNANVLMLMSPDGKILSTLDIKDPVHDFDGFDSKTGNFFMETDYNWVYWGYDHEGFAVTMGNVTDNTIDLTPRGNSIVVNGMLTYDLQCIEYVCQKFYIRHVRGADLLGGKYLVTVSSAFSRKQILDSEATKQYMVLPHDVSENNSDKGAMSYFDQGSVGVRAVYNERNDSIITYEPGKIVNEYDPHTSKKLATFTPAHYVFNMHKMGDTLILIEKEDQVYYMETVDWSKPKNVTVKAEKDVMEIGETQQLSVISDSDVKTDYRWVSRNESIATVSEYGGILTAWRDGTVVIDCYNSDKELVGNVSVIVQPRLDSEIGVSPITGKITGNISENNYYTYGKVVNSYLFENDGKLTRVEYCDKSVLVEDHALSGQLLSSKTIEMPLPIFGGFFNGSTHYYLVFGQKNDNDSDSTEVMRIRKYTKDWQLVSECSVFGANTYIPFDAGSLRMTETGGKLYIHTCHEMYKSEDGFHHQANMTFVINEADMTVEQSYYDVMNIAQAGYVSHSFNQFVQTDGEYVYRVDHGDAHPRAVTITKCKVDGKITNVSYNYLLTIKIGGYGNNYTGASVGGFELSSENCIATGNSIDHNQESSSLSDARNIFVTIISKDLRNKKTVWLTNYPADSSIRVGTPHLVKLNDEQFIVLWEEFTSDSTTVISALIDSSGNVVSKTELNGFRLSDCKPILTSNGLLTWYVTDKNSIRLYEYDPYAIPTHTHQYGNELCFDENGHWYACSCGDQSNYEEHISDGGRVIYPPSENSAGKKVYSCLVCKTVLEYDFFGYNNGAEHSCSFDEWRYDQKCHWRECACGNQSGVEEHLSDGGKLTIVPTESNSGRLVYTCQICGKEYKTELIPPMDPNDPISQFVERLYLNILNRPSDIYGKACHVNNLKNGKNACEVAYDFVFSPEFADLPISNEERVKRMYVAFLDREADPAGLAGWTAVLDKGCSIGHIFYGFTQSNEFTKICSEYGIKRGTWEFTENRDRSAELTAFVSRLYDKALGRTYDADGLNNHTGAYLKDHDLYQLAYGFIFSQEFIDKNLSDEQFVDTMYRTFFDREPDPAGKAYWLKELKDGKSREYVLAGFVGSQECIDLVARFGI